MTSWSGEASLHIAARLIDIKHPNQPVCNTHSIICLIVNRIISDSFFDKSSILEYLINQSKINLNIQDNQGRTPLHFAIIYRCKGNAKCLIEYGADPDVSFTTCIFFPYKCFRFLIFTAPFHSIMLFGFFEMKVWLACSWTFNNCSTIKHMIIRDLWMLRLNIMIQKLLKIF